MMIQKTVLHINKGYCRFSGLWNLAK